MLLLVVFFLHMELSDITIISLINNYTDDNEYILLDSTWQIHACTQYAFV